jgi:NAD(P)-dependent dehydrogenase (short-subunit alcohol dehydrogenase family)
LYGPNYRVRLTKVHTITYRAIPADVRKFEDVENAVKATIEKYGRIDYLINGAAGNFLSPFENLSPNAFRTVIEIDLIGKQFGYIRRTEYMFY